MSDQPGDSPTDAARREPDSVEAGEVQGVVPESQNRDHEVWEREGKRLKTLRVAVVLMFWFSVAFQAVLYYLEEGRFNIVLLSIISGMLVLGVVLKVRYQRHLSMKP